MGGGEEPLKLCVNGNLGSGKSTVAKALAERMGLTYFSTGGVQRELAKSLGISILELNQRAETDKTIDTQLDAQFEPIAAKHARIIFDSRLAWNFVPDAVKIRLLCHPATSAARIHGDKDSSRGVEAFESVEAARASIAERRGSERKRFLDLYEVDIEELGNYDLVLQTDLAAPDLVISAVEGWLAGPRAPGSLLLSPRMIFPLAGVKEAGAVEVLCSGDCFFAASGLTALSDAARSGGAWIEARRLDPAALAGESATGFARARFDATLAEQWQSEGGFTFSISPEI